LTWDRDSFGLFDYENPNVNRKTMVMKRSNYICRYKNEVSCIPKGMPSKEFNDTLVLIKMDDRDFK